MGGVVLVTAVRVALLGGVVLRHRHGDARRRTDPFGHRPGDHVLQRRKLRNPLGRTRLANPAGRKRRRRNPSLLRTPPKPSQLHPRNVPRHPTPARPNRLSKRNPRNLHTARRARRHPRTARPRVPPSRPHPPSPRRALENHPIPLARTGSDSADHTRRAARLRLGAGRGGNRWAPFWSCDSSSAQ